MTATPGRLTAALDRSEPDAAKGDGLSAVAIWLWTVAALVFAMIIVGGATRLTDSGLSITEWKPILGAIPPLSEAHWLEAFEKYRQIPEYHLVNKGMSLDEFKVIFWWEWAHRFLGRVIGLAMALPLVGFWLAGRLAPAMTWKLLGVLALGGLQGAIGWYMVSSGLAERVDVSQYRLALHLTTAFVIFGCLIWLALELSDKRASPRTASENSVLRTTGAALVVLVLLQVVFGAFVAGLKAGLVYNTWPDMNGAFLPPDYWTTTPAYLSFFESHAATQFNHRLMAYLLGGLAIAHVWMTSRQSADHCQRFTAIVLLAAVFAQMLVGIYTVLWGVPLPLGLLHQGGGALVLAIAVWNLYAIRTASGPSQD